MSSLDIIFISIQPPHLSKTSKTSHVGFQAEAADDGNAAALARYKMVDARLRRLCERKPSGKLQVPEAIHAQWAAGGKQRDELRALLEQFDFDREP